MVEDIGDVLRLVWRTRFDHPAFGFDIDGLAVFRHALGALLEHPGFFNSQVDLFRFNILNLAAHWRGIDIQACQNIGRGVHADGAAGQFKVIVAAVDLNTQPTLQLFDVVVKRAAQC